MAVKRYFTREGFVYIPELKTDGRNWMEYRKCILEVASTQNLLGHLAGVEQKPKVIGNERNEWLRQNSNAQSILMWNIPDSLFSHIRHFETAHEMFNYLATKFRDSTRIPLPTEKRVEASNGDVAADKPPSTKHLPKQKDGSAFEAHASGDEMQDELRESCTRPNELSVEPPREERLEDKLTEARSNDEAEAAVGVAQQVPPRSTPFETPSTLSQDAAYEQPRKGEDIDGTASSSDVDPMQVEAAMLAAESQDAYRGQNEQCNLPVLSRQLTTTRKRLYETAKPRHRRGRIKSEARNISTMQKVENTCQGHGNAKRSTRRHREGVGMFPEPTFECWKQGERQRPARNRCNPNTNMFRRPRGPGGQGEVQEAFRDVETNGKWCQMGSATSSARRNSKQVETRLLARDQAGQHKQQMRKPSNVPGPPGGHRKRSDEVNGPKRRSGTIKFEPRHVSRARKLENAHQGRSNAMRLIPHHREGIGTCHDVTIKFRNPIVDFPRPSDRKRHARDSGDSPQALQSTK